jgi:hypothetical protein
MKKSSKKTFKIPSYIASLDFGNGKLFPKTDYYAHGWNDCVNKIKQLNAPRTTKRHRVDR